MKTKVKQCLTCGKECETDFCSKRCAKKWIKLLEFGYKANNDKELKETWAEYSQPLET